MNHQRNKPIKSKLMSIVMLACAAVLVLACSGFAIYETVSVRQSKLEEMTLVGDLIGSNSAPALSFNDAQAGEETLTTLKASPHVIAARIYDKDGKPFATYLRAKASASEIPDSVTLDAYGFENGSMRVVRGIYVNGRRIGSVYLLRDLGELNTRLLRYAAISCGMLLVAMALAFLLASRLQRTISGPILALAQRAGSIQQSGDYSIGDVHGRYQEIGLLIESFDGMLHSIAQRDNELRRHRECLEEEVAARTVEIRTVNAQLEGAKVAAETAKESAEAASRSKSEFLANMSHEIRTPMNGILGMTELALETNLSSVQRDYLSVVKSCADGLLFLLNDILDFSKIEAGKLSLDPHVFPLHEMIADAMKGLSLRAHQKGLELAFELDQDVPEYIVGDPGRLRQIIVNLTGNAIKFTEHGEVVLTVSREPKADGLALRFSVRDSGIGIPEDKLSKIFVAFEQADNSTTRHYGGTGLGLSISTRLVEIMQGKIWVESRVGVGSVFHFTANFAAATAPVEKYTTASAEELRGTRVLVVDDNATNRCILQKMLASWGMLVDLVESGPDAMALLYKSIHAGITYPLIILDGHMPGMDGFALLERIRGDKELKVGKAMMLTSAEQMGATQRCEDLAISEYALKPIAKSDLLTLVLRILGKAGPESSQTSAAPITDSARPLRILLAEDNVYNQKVAIGMLKMSGHTITVAGNGRIALETFKKQQFDLVLMDMQMPEMDGMQATKLIRQRQESTGIRVPIIAMTAHAMTGDREKCLAAGMDDYISKPISRDELITVIQRNSGPLTCDVKATAAPDPVPVQCALDSGASGSGAEEPHSNNCIDKENMLRRFGGDQELLLSLTEMFPDEAAKLLTALRDARVAHKADEVQLNAHTLKGMCKMFEASTAAEAASDLEVTAAAGGLGTDIQVNTLNEELARVVSAVRSFQETLCS
jgi:two-component system sensor histidine kinase/response regulator